jgi:hypothetical protein
MTRVSVAPCVGEGMVVRRVQLRAKDIVFFKGIVDASEGLAQVFSARGEDLTVASPADREAELDAMLDDLCAELGAIRLD